MKKIILTSKFPIKHLNEGTVKQVYYHKKILEKQKEGTEEKKVIIVDPEKQSFTKRIKQKADIIHFFNVPSIEVALTLMFSKYKKSILTIYDGDVGTFYKNKIFMTFFKKILFKKIDVITTTSKYQKKLILKYLKDKKLEKTVEKKIKIIPPLILEEKGEIKTKNKDENNKIKKQKNTILYMSSIREHKGIQLLLYSIKKLLEKDKIDIKVTIANSNFAKAEKKIVEEIKKLKKKYPKNIVLKGRINPEEELKKHEIYFYTFTTLKGTFGVPLSIIEAEKNKTEYISTNFESLKEYFQKEFLITPKKEEAYKKLKDIIKNKKQYIVKQNLSKKENIKKTIKKIKELYE